MKRTSTTASCCSLPTRRTTPSWITRRSLAWSGIVISVSSSRNSVPPCAVSQQPRLVPVGAGERTFPVPEHLALEQRLGQRGAVDRHQEPARATAVLVDELSDDLLAGAALAADHHRCIGGRDLPRQLHGLAEQGRDSDQGNLVAVAVLLHQLDAEILGFTRHHHRVRRAPDEHLEMGRGEGLREVVPGAGAQCLDAAGDAGIAGHHHHDRVLLRSQRRLQDLQSGDLGHVQVDQDDIELAPFDGLDGFLATPDDGHVVPVHLEHTGATFPQGPFVIHHENPDARLDLCRDRQRIARRLRSRSTALVGLGEHVGHLDSTTRGHSGTPRAGCWRGDAQRQRIDVLSA